VDPLIRKCEDAAGLLKLLAHGPRLKILCLLSNSEQAVGQITAACGVSQSRVSQFLAKLKSEGLVSARRDGKFVYYRIADARARKLIQALRRLYLH
jgi:ArsR family transcriptional regulator